jgi:hypothetical protein
LLLRWSQVAVGRRFYTVKGATAIKALRTPYYVVAITACCVVGLGVAAFVSKDAIAKQLNDWYLLPRTENLTELYFTNYRTLPASLKADTAHGLAFTIHNLEHRTTTYQYKLVATSEDNSVTKTLGDGTVTLAPGDSRVEEKTVTVPAIDERVNISVHLEYQGIAFGDNAPRLQTHAIRYWVKIVSLTTDDKADNDRA